MYSPKEVFKKEPAVLAGALQTVINAVVGFGLVSASAEQLAGVNSGGLLDICQRSTFWRSSRGTSASARGRGDEAPVAGRRAARRRLPGGRDPRMARPRPRPRRRARGGVASHGEESAPTRRQFA